jgi:PilZ domain
VFHFETLTDFYTVVMRSLYSHHTRIDPSTRNESVWRKFLIERPRARRYLFAASIDLVDMESETETREQTTDLSVFGCQVTAQKPLVTGTKVRLRIIHRGAIFAAQGQIANVRRSSMGVVFSKMEQKDQAVLEKWLAEARDTHERTISAR